MGLEMVELVMELEDEFKITIPDKDVNECQTLGSCNDLMLKLIREKPDSDLARRPDLDAYVWEMLTKFAAECTMNTTKADEMTRDTHFINDLDFG